MRRKKHKHTRRAVRFFKINYGFREPFKVILDGNFVHTTQQANIGDLHEAISRLLGGAVKLYVTGCVRHEIKALGSEFAETLGLCRDFSRARCDHDDAPLSPADCILSLIGTNNPEHFFVATQDRRLRECLGRVKGGACCFASVNGLHVEEPSGMLKEKASESASRNMVVSKAERKTAPLKELATILSEAPKEKSKFRLQHAKGPNPLAAKKKKTKKKGAAAEAGGAAQRVAESPAEGPEGEAEKQASGRKRVRKKKKASVEAGPGSPVSD